MKLANGTSSNECIKYVWRTIAKIDSYKYSIVLEDILSFRTT